MNKFGIEIATKDRTLCVLACELDNENLWDELSETEFTSKVLDGLSVEIDKNKYIYTLRNTSELEIRLIDLESCKPISEYVDAQHILNKLTDNDYIRKVHTEDNEAEFTVLGNNLTIKEVKLISFKKRNSIIQFVISTV